MVENKDGRRSKSGTTMRMINSQPLGEVQGQPVEVDSRGLSQPIAEVVTDEKVPVPVNESSVPSDSDNQPSSSESLNETR